MTNQTIISTVQKYFDDIEGADADTSSVLTALRLATLELSSIPIVKHRLFPQTSTSITLVADQTDYALPTNYNYNISRVIWDNAADIGSRRDLGYYTNEQIFEAQQGGGAYIDGYTVRGTKLVLNGTPDTAQAGKTLRVEYSELPDITLLQNDGTETLLGTKYPYALIDMAVRRFLLLDVDNAGLYDRYKALVDEHKEDIRQELETVSSPGEFSQEFPNG